MRWKLPTYGDERIVSVFLFLPKRIGNERRWLEFAKCKEYYEVGGWIPYMWVN